MALLLILEGHLFTLDIGAYWQMFQSHLHHLDLPCLGRRGRLACDGHMIFAHKTSAPKLQADRRHKLPAATWTVVSFIVVVVRRII